MSCDSPVIGQRHTTGEYSHSCRKGWHFRQRNKAIELNCLSLASQSISPFALDIRLVEHIICEPRNHRIVFLPEKKVVLCDQSWDWEPLGGLRLSLLGEQNNKEAHRFLQPSQPPSTMATERAVGWHWNFTELKNKNKNTHN